MRRHHQWIIVALLIIVASLAFVLYRRDKTHTLSFDNTGVVGTARPGDTLEWRPAPFSSEFEVVFWASTPCVDKSGNPEPKVESKHGVASCKVGNIPDGKNYGYNINLFGEGSAHPNGSPRNPCNNGCIVPLYPCRGCLIKSPPFDPNHQYPKDVDHAPSPADATPVIFTCSNGKFGVTGPDGKVSAISWKPDAQGTTNWHVTFPSNKAQPALCNEGNDFHDGNDICTLVHPPLNTSSFTITSAECPSDTTLFPAPSK